MSEFNTNTVDDSLGFDDTAMDYFNEATNGEYDDNAGLPLATQQSVPDVYNSQPQPDEPQDEFYQYENGSANSPSNNNVAEAQPPTPVMSQDDQHTVSPTTSGGIQTQHQQTQITQANSQFVMSDMTAVDGHGMWTSWTRVFDQPRYACLDLLDNCLDATLNKPNFEGRVVMKRLPPNGIIILNNSATPIKSLKEVLVIYASSKRDGKDQKKTDAIGENGVGLKHGCATLSDTNFVLTRNFSTYSFGIIARSLQSNEGVNLPSFDFTIEDDEDKSPEEIESELRHHLQTIVDLNPKIAQCVEAELGHGNLHAGIQRLVTQCQEMWNDDWEVYDHVFQVLITKLIHDHDQLAHDSVVEVTSSRAHNGKNPASMFLKEMKELLPKFYVNIPAQGFEFLIEGERVLFSYWQHRLVEMTKFKVHVPKEEAIQDFRYDNWDKTGYPLSIYCGFEALRVEDEERGDACQMYIYSRSSGRLIQIDDDARAVLQLSATGVDYGQGLTVIIDDVDAQLPLMPTKQGIAWTEQRGGETHKNNLFAWAGAVAQCYWSHHSKLFQKRCVSNAFKKILRQTIKDFADPVRFQMHLVGRMGSANNHGNQNGLPALERLEAANFTTFADVSWKKDVTTVNRRLKIRRTQKALDIEPGEATVHKFTDEHYPAPEDCPQPKPRSKKRKLNESPPEPEPEQWQPRPWQQQPHWQQQQQLQQQWRQQQQLQRQQQQQEVIVLDDDDDDDNAKSEAATPRRSVARKSTGGSNPSGGSGKTNGSISPGERNLRRAFFACQEELREQKRLMAETQIAHQDSVRRLQEELRYAQQAAKVSTQNGHRHHGSTAQETEALREAQDELTIVKRQKKQLEKELRDVRDKRGSDDSGSHLEIEALKLKLEQHAQTIRKLKEGNGHGAADDESAGSGGNGSYVSKSRMLQPKIEYEGTDEI